MTWITSPNIDLTLGAVDLLGSKNTTPGWWIEALGDDHDEGNPVPVEKEIASFLQDGTIKSIESYDNREMTLTLRVTGTSSANLAAAESALMAEVGERNVLTWTPPDSTGTFAGTPCVFDVVTSHLDFSFDDVDELRLVRTYKLTITASPWARSQTLNTVTVAAPPAGAPAVTVVDAGTATTNWTKTTTGSGTVAGPTVVSGTVQASITNNTASPQAQSVTLTRSSMSASMTTTPYVRLVWAGGSNGFIGAWTKTFKINGTVVTPVATSGTTYWFAMPGGATTLTSLAIVISGTTSAGSGIVVSVDDISRSSGTTDITGQRQTYSSLAVAGSVRTEGNLALVDATPAALGSVLVYTVPNPGSLAQPNLRVNRSDGGADSTDTSTVSGKTSTISATSHTFDIPASQVPTGGYALMVRIKHASTGTYALTGGASSMVGSLSLDVGVASTQTVSLTAGVYQIVDLAHLTLPSVQMGANGIVRVAIFSNTAVGLVLDEAWLFNMDLGQLTWVECGTTTPTAGGASNRLWLDAADLDSPVPAVYRGVASDRSDAYYAMANGTGQPAMNAFGRHQFVPPLTNVFKVTTNSIACGLTLTSYPRFHSNVV